MIYIELTPNPKTRKFISDIEITNAPGDYTANDIENIPLLEGIFSFPGVTEIYVGHSFISVTVDDENDWDSNGQLKNDLSAFIDQNLDKFWYLHPSTTSTGEGVAYKDKDADIVILIKDTLDKWIRPAVAHDGGDITFSSFRDGVLTVEMKGACSGCPSSTVTLKHGIQNMMKHYVPQVTEVRAL